MFILFFINFFNIDFNIIVYYIKIINISIFFYFKKTQNNLTKKKIYFKLICLNKKI